MAGMHLFFWGYGYSATWIAQRMRRQAPGPVRVSGTRRQPAPGAEARIYAYRAPGALEDFAEACRDATHMIAGIPPDAEGDPVWRAHGQAIARLPKLQWFAYLSTTGVYGGHDGGWVDETTLPAPMAERQQWRLMAERQWLSLDMPAHIFRLAGIYGPGRSTFDALEAGRARRIAKPGHVMNRIHVADLAGALALSALNPTPGEIFNLCDDAPAPAEAVTAHAAGLAGQDAPPLEPYRPERLTPMMQGFYAANRRVSNGKAKKILGWAPEYPDYGTGLASIWKMRE